MKKSRFTEEWVAHALHQAEGENYSLEITFGIYAWALS